MNAIIEKIKGAFSEQSFASKAAEILPFLIFFTALFVVDKEFFGISDALLGIVFLFFSRSIVTEQPGLSFRNYMTRVAWFFVMSLTATLAGLHPMATVVVSVIYILLMTMLNSDDYLPRNFFWLGMGYLMLLIYPVDVDGIATRLIATVFSLACTTVFIFTMRFVWKKTGKLDVFARDRSYVRRSFDRVGKLLGDLAEGIRTEDETTSKRVNTRETINIAQQYADMEYGSVFRQGGVLSGRQNYTFALLLCCEQVADMAHAAANNLENMGEEERVYYRDLSKVFLGYGEGRIKSVGEMVHELVEFLDHHYLPVGCHEEAWRGILEATLRTLRDTRMSKDNSTPFAKGFRYRMKYLKENITLSNTQTRFSLQLAAVVGVGMIAANIAIEQGEEFGVWIPIVAFTILNTYNDQTLRSTLETIAGTLIGIAVFAIAVHFIPESCRMILVVLLSYFLILLNIGPICSCIGGTQMALTALYWSSTLGDTVVSRMVLVVVAVACVMMFIFVFMHTRRTVTIRTKVQELERIDTRLSRIIHGGLDDGKVNLWRTVQLLYYMHMDSQLLERLVESLHNGRKLPGGRIIRPVTDEQLALDVEEALRLNYKFAMDAAHAVMLMGVTSDKTGAMRALNLDSTGRIRHIDATLDRVDQKLDRLEAMRYLEDVVDTDEH